MTIQRIGFQAIAVGGQNRALAFYRDILGFVFHTDALYGDGWRSIFQSMPGAQTRLQFSERSEITIYDTPALAPVNDDVDADCKVWADRGAQNTNGPTDAPWQPGARYCTLRHSEDNIVFIESFTAREG